MKTHRELHRRCLVSLLWTFLGLGPTTSMAQEPAESFVEELEVRDGRIDVVVTGADDYPVLGLTRDDFELVVDGTPVPITELVAFESESALRVGGPEGSATERRTDLEEDERLFLAILFDRTFLDPGDLEATLDPLREFLGSLGPRDRVMLATADPRLELVERFEEGPPARVLDTLADLVDQPQSGRSFLSEYRNLLEELGPARAYGPQALLRAEATLARVEAFAADGHARVQRAAANLHQLISQVAGLPGRRVVLYVGGDLPIGLGQELVAAWRQSYGESSPFARLPESEGGPDLEAESRLFKTGPRIPDHGAEREFFAEIARHANLARVSVVPVDTAALRASPSLVSRRGVQRFGAGPSAFGGPSKTVLAELARTTGGQVLDERASALGAWRPFTRELANFYRLTFSAPDGAGESELGLEVQLRSPGPGVEVRHPASIAFPSLDQEAIDRIRAAVVLGAEHNILGISTKILELERETAATRARLQVRIPMPNLALLPSGEDHLGRLTVFVLAASWEGSSSSPIKAVLPIRMSRDELLASVAAPVEFSVEVLLPPGADSIGIGVRDHFASVFSTTVAELPAELDTAPPADP